MQAGSLIAAVPIRSKAAGLRDSFFQQNVCQSHPHTAVDSRNKKSAKVTRVVSKSGKMGSLRYAMKGYVTTNPCM